MKVYYIDYWYIFNLKIAKRVIPRVEDYTDRIHHLSIAITITSLIPLTTIIAVMPVWLEIDFNSIYLVSILLFSITFIIYYRYIKGDSWQQIEQVIDQKRKTGKRDLYFSLITLFYFFIYSFSIILIVSCKEDVRYLFNSIATI